MVMKTSFTNLSSINAGVKKKQDMKRFRSISIEYKLIRVENDLNNHILAKNAYSISKFIIFSSNYKNNNINLKGG